MSCYSLLSVLFLFSSACCHSEQRRSHGVVFVFVSVVAEISLLLWCAIADVFEQCCCCAQFVPALIVLHL